MSKTQGKTPQSARDRQSPGAGALTGAEVKTRLKERGLTLKQWAEKKGYPYDTVSCVVRGVNRATFGMGHRIATELGLK